MIRYRLERGTAIAAIKVSDGSVGQLSGQQTVDHFRRRRRRVAQMNAAIVRKPVNLAQLKFRKPRIVLGAGLGVAVTESGQSPLHDAF
ncbi:hypothetical protein SDC9_121306 [bioreactor metagenome]|uniref:Uncharacterized protein n=1 Tax=bioreactor metagenome TaxID=1076179 RepID=A0A645CBL4_9ZZZZ